MFKKITVLLSSALVLSACVHVPEKLRVDEGQVLTNFTAVKESAANTHGQQARWGGVIAGVTNNQDNTMLEIVHFDLKSSTRPSVKDETKGRFRVYYDGLLDPVIYKKGRSITALGVVQGEEAGKIGEHDYQYPVLKANYVHLWKEVKEVDVRVNHYPHWYTPSLWYYPRPYYYRTYPVSVRSAGKGKSQTK